MKHNTLARLVIFFSFLLFALPAFGASFTFKDPRKDDKGPGKYRYPTASIYKKGDFDMTRFVVKDRGSSVEFRIYLRNRIKDVWKSKSWGGNGFSTQFAQIYIDMDRKPGSGKRYGLPGLNIQFPRSAYWDRVILVSPQGRTRLKMEINLKARRYKSRIIIPSVTRAQGKALIVVVPKSALGGSPSKSWAWQVVIQSNEGYPRPKDLLTRPVNEYEGKHRFGGGNDGDCDPHVLDILAGAAKGLSSERKAQYKALSGYRCGKGKKRLATVPMIIPR